MSQSVRESITTILSRVDDLTTERLIPLVYAELKRMAAGQLANDTPGNTLQPTALVHEAYMRLIEKPNMQWENRGHFFAAAARSMRQILINRAHRRNAAKRGGRYQHEMLDEQGLCDESDPERTIALDKALDKLEQLDERKARIVMLRYFAGLTIEETSQALQVSPATIKREWKFSRTWLYREMSDDDHG